MVHDDISLAERLKREAHRISNMILNSDLPWFDISLQINHMRELVADEAPDKMDLFEAIYTARFERLWEQWREGIEPPEPQWPDYL